MDTMDILPLHTMLEGPDGSGKSTIAKLLSEKFDVRIIEMYTNRHIFETCIEECSEVFNRTLLQFKHIPFIMPRGFISSLVYSKIYKRTYDLSYIEEVSSILRPTVIYLKVDKDTIRKRKEDEFTNSKIFDIIDGYEEFFNDTNLLDKYNITLLTIDTTNLTIDQTIEHILKSSIMEF
jgi:thymidylate kinase